MLRTRQSTKVAAARSSFDKEQTMNKLMWVIVFGLLAACSLEWRASHQASEGEIGENWGPNLGGAGGQPVLHLPFAYGQSRRCTQGAHDPFSHNSPATEYDLDLDTSNLAYEEIYAPAPGVAYVHMNHPDTNFGYHVNIDLGDGTYAVLGHLREVFVRDGDGVAAGQLLGIEGCTGYCTGDHVHLGRHQGLAWEEAHLGESVPFSVHLPGQDLPSESFICGLDNGQWYASVLPEVNSHANGTLIKSAQDAKTYLLEQGSKRWIEYQDVFWSLGYDFQQVLMVSADELAVYPPGLSINQSGEVRAAFDGMGRLWLMVDDGQQRWRLPVGSLNSTEVLNSWGFSQEPLAYGEGSAELFDAWPAYRGWANFRDGTLLKEKSRSDVYIVSDQTAVPIESWSVFLKAGYRPERIFTITDQSVAYHFTSVGSCLDPDGICLREANLRAGGPMDLGVPPPPAMEPIVITPDPKPDAGVMSDAAWPDTGEPQEPESDASIEIEPDAGQAMDATEVSIGPPSGNSYLGVRWTTPFGVPAARITLSGEYTFADGSLGFAWHELKSVGEAAEIFWSLYGVSSGDRFRFSVEFEDASGYVSWSCLGPYVEGTSQQGTVQGTVLAHVDNQQIFAQTTGDPSGETTGCGLLVIIP